MKKIIFSTILTGVFSIFSFAQTKEPSKPIRDYIVKTNQEVSAIEKALGDENKVTDLLCAFRFGAVDARRQFGKSA